MKRAPVLLLLGVLLTLFAGPVLARDQWIQVRTKNFFLVGNASERHIRAVANKMEQFRETFRVVFSGLELRSPVPTNVVVFKSESSFRQFKPRREDGKIDAFVAGYFQPGDDVNYITLSTEGDDQQTFSVIFHEYVHSIVDTNFGRSEVPAWFNEGLAEYYSSFAIEDDIKAKLGLPIDRHLSLLARSKFIPLKTLLSASNSEMSNSGDHSRSIFYAESWALIHYLFSTGKNASLAKFLELVINGTQEEEAFRQAFGTTYAGMEDQLRKYVTSNHYKFQEITFRKKMLFDEGSMISPLDEAAVNTYLGDLLYHTRRFDDAEPFLRAALQLQPGSSRANTALGLVKLRQRKFEEARGLLELAVSNNSTNAQAYYNYAYLLSREGQDEFGLSRPISKQTAEKMRSALRRAIQLKPDFTPSYELLAYAAIATNDQLEDAAGLMRQALNLKPGDQSYALRLAEIMLRLNKFDESRPIAEKVARTTDDPTLRSRAEQLLDYLAKREEFQRSLAQREKPAGETDSSGERPVQKAFGDKPMNAAELAAAKALATLRSINGLLRKPAPNEQRVIGRIERIACRKGISYTVRTATDTFTLTGENFDRLDLNIFSEEAGALQVGCDADLSKFTAVITFRPAASKAGSRGELAAIEFVHADFRFMTETEMKQSAPLIVAVETIDEKGIAKDPLPTDEEIERIRRQGVIDSMRNAVRQPGEGQKRGFGFLERVECTNQGRFFIFRTQAATLRLAVNDALKPDIRIFTPDLAGIHFGCDLKPVESPVVFVYTDVPDAKAKTVGTVIAMDFMPRSFVLE